MNTGFDNVPDTSLKSQLITIVASVQTVLKSAAQRECRRLWRQAANACALQLGAVRRWRSSPHCHQHSGDAVPARTRLSALLRRELVDQHSCLFKSVQYSS